MSVFEVHGGGDRRSLIKRFMNKSKQDAVSELVEIHLTHCSRADRLEAENAELRALLDTPHTADWFEGVKLEAGHQIKRWSADHDAGKTPADWFWLIGYLAQKAMTAQMGGDDEKARHHTISTGAAMLNWFRAIVGDSTAMRPGIEAPAEDDVPDFTPGNGNKARRRADALGIDYAAAMAKVVKP